MSLGGTLRWSGLDGTVVDELDLPIAHFECKSVAETTVVAAREAASEHAEASRGALLAEVVPPAAAAPKTAMPLRTVFDAYAREAELAPSTVKRWSPVVDRLIAHLGHDDTAAISRADIVGWKDALLAGIFTSVLD
jgi:hypothetical protein